jgi:hypothetical protein
MSLTLVVVLPAPSIGAMSTYWPVAASKTATFLTLSTTVPSRCWTWVNLPPTHTLLPTCSMVRTGPLTMRVWSGVSEGKARATPLARSTARTIETNN